MKEFETFVMLYKVWNINIHSTGYYQFRITCHNSEIKESMVSYRAQKLTNSNHCVKQPVYYDNTYQTKVFQLRYLQEFVEVGEAIKYVTRGTQQGTISFELWFQKAHPSKKESFDFAKMKLVDEQRVSFVLSDTFAHHVVQFNNPYFVALQIDVFSIAKNPSAKDLFPIQWIENPTQAQF